MTFLLDVDGTLVDSNDAHAHAWRETFAAHGHEVDLARIRERIGMGGDRLVEALLGIARDSDENKSLGEERSKRFADHWLRTVKALPGARELVLAIRARGARYAIATAAKDEELQPLLEIAKIEDLVEVKTTSSDVEESKPDPEIVKAALARLRADRETAVMVGDTPYDVRAARDAGIAAIGLRSGGWSAEALEGAIEVFDGPLALAEALGTVSRRALR